MFSSNSVATGLDPMVAAAPCRCHTEFYCISHTKFIDVDMDATEEVLAATLTTEPPPPEFKFPTTRRVTRRQIDRSTLEHEVRQWISDKKIQLGTQIPAGDMLDVMQTLYTYRDLESTGVEGMGTPTNLLQHRTRLKPNTPIYRVHAKKLAPEKEFWLREFALDGLNAKWPLFERTIMANGELLRWGAHAVIIKRDNAEPRRSTITTYGRSRLATPCS
ncbi:hypothetical protein LTR12_017187 [Friedmanniomyces endolithicus]|uniref:Uncharacterized protein n=1 Tax=Friedmanniomyces simplex TaxID=329884 RepID=A0A4U0WUH2_9PEZI|nr:hypothetical protein LTR74_016227 [Friedmanniomyces endolithicus]KAK1808459.1 hypothetical protein LTR12_017187 [Friedmanniomyces endolithicus]TKA66667.1 hypothetical protein B0A55_09023 [Friedmanniomyces simplex]